MSSDQEEPLDLPTDSDSSGGSCESNPFDFIQFRSGKQQNSRTNSAQTHYETFVDHGEEFEPNIQSQIKDQYSDNDKFVAAISDQYTQNDKQNKKDSMILASKAVRAICRKSSESEPNIVLTSTARLNFGGLKPQISATSNVSSSFSSRMSGNYMGVENLAKIPEDTELKRPRKLKKPHPVTTNNAGIETVYPVSPILLSDDRHSMPTYFVGNRFNRSDLTAVYIPTWKDRNEMQNQSVDYEDKMMVGFQSSVLVEEEDAESDENIEFQIYGVSDKMGLLNNTHCNSVASGAIVLESTETKIKDMNQVENHDVEIISNGDNTK